MSLEVKGGGLECNRGEWFRLDRAGRPRADARPVRSGPGPSLRTRAQDRAGRRDGAIASCSSSTRSRSPTSPCTSSCSHPTRRPNSSSTATAIKDIAGSIDEVLAYHEGSREQARTRPAPKARRCCATCSPRRSASRCRWRRPSTRRRTRSCCSRASSRPCSGAWTETGGWSSPDAPARARRCSASSARDGSPSAGAACCSCASTRRSPSTCSDTVAIEGLDVFTFHRLCTHWAKRRGRRAADVRGPGTDVVLERRRTARAHRSHGARRRPVRRPRRRRGAGPAQRLAARRDDDAARRGVGLDLAVHGRQPAHLPRRPRRARRVSALRPHRQLPQHPGDPPRGHEALPRRDRARRAGTAGTADGARPHR